MWRADQHTLEQNMHWALLRAVEWLAWPIFLSQPVVPILLIFYPWQWIVALVVLASFLWRAFIAGWATSMIADLGPIFVLLKFVSAPVSAFLLWREHHPWTALMALLWPVLGPLVAGWLLAAPYALLVLTRVGEQAQIGADLRVPHLFCDPNRAERAELEIRDDAAGYAAREQVWLGRLESMISAPHANVLFACGASHVGTFSDVLQARSLLSRVLVEDWTTL